MEKQILIKDYKAKLWKIDKQLVISIPQFIRKHYDLKIGNEIELDMRLIRKESGNIDNIQSK